MSQKLVPPSTFSEDVATGVSVYAMIDVSPSMRGSKIGEVCTSIKDIIESCPPMFFLILEYSTIPRENSQQH
jgi:hypothetical protein